MVELAYAASRSRLPHDGSRVVPASFSQAGRLALARGPDAWRKPPMVFGYRITGRHDASALEAALVEVARRHTALRTYFPLADDTENGVCRSARDARWPVRRVDLTAIPEAGQAAAEQDTLAWLNTPFDHAESPLLRAALLTYAENDHVLGLAIDHIIFDGASLPIFLAGLADAYRAYAAGQPPPPAPGSDASAFARAEREWLASPAGARAVDYWRPIWDGIGPFPASGMPTRPPGAATGGATWSRELPETAVTAARGRFGGGHISLFAFAAGAALTALSGLTGQRDCALLYPSARRSTSGTAAMIGYLNNRNLLRVKISPGDGLPDVAARARSVILSSLEHELMPFEYLMERFGAAAARRPRVPYIFLSVDAPLGVPDFGEAVVEPVPLMPDAAFSQLSWITVSVDQLGSGQLGVSCGYNAGLLYGEFVDELMSRFSALLTA
jgi:Condensation domain